MVKKPLQKQPQHQHHTTAAADDAVANVLSNYQKHSE